MIAEAVFDAKYLLGQYELLRGEVLAMAPGTQRGHGLLLFLTRGMVSWMQALSSLSPCPTPVPADASIPFLSSRPQVAQVLANMVLGCMEGRCP